MCIFWNILRQESFYEIPPIILADRYFVESEGDCARMCAQAVDQDVAFLVVGDPLW
jgi:diphthamide biosynthesis methyltransferase